MYIELDRKSNSNNIIVIYANMADGNGSGVGSSSNNNNNNNFNNDRQLNRHTSSTQSRQQQQHEEIANLLQYARSSYMSNPTDALSALMGALTLSSGNNMAAQHAMQRIRTELGDVVADRLNQTQRTQQQQLQRQHQHAYSEGESREMIRRAMEIVQQLLNDESTFLYAQGRQHLLQQAMEDGSSVVCTKCGDMIKLERIEQHTEYWCRVIEDEKSCSDEDDTKMEND